MEKYYSVLYYIQQWRYHFESGRAGGKLASGRAKKFFDLHLLKLHLRGSLYISGPLRGPLYLHGALSFLCGPFTHLCRALSHA